MLLLLGCSVRSLACHTVDSAWSSLLSKLGREKKPSFLYPRSFSSPVPGTSWTSGVCWWMDADGDRSCQLWGWLRYLPSPQDDKWTHGHWPLARFWPEGLDEAAYLDHLSYASLSLTTGKFWGKEPTSKASGIPNHCLKCHLSSSGHGWLPKLGGFFFFFFFVFSPMIILGALLKSF